MESKKKVYMFVYGCSNLKVDGNIYAEYLKANGFEVVNSVQEAQSIIFLGCGVVQEFEDDSIRKINELVLIGLSHGIPVYIGGCIVRIADNRIDEINGTFHVIRNFDEMEIYFPSKRRLYDTDYGNKNYPIAITPTRPLIGRMTNVDKKMKARDRIRAIDVMQRTKFSFYYEYMTDFPYSEELEKVYNVVISRGCAFQCSYCVIRVGRGAYESRTINDILVDYQKGLSQGYRRFNLVAEENGNYGIDIPGKKTTLVTLLLSLCEMKSDSSFALKYVHPIPFLKYFEILKELVVNNRLFYLCVPLQTASQKLLNKMNRYYDPKEVAVKINELKTIDPSLLTITHVMSGFPSETEEDHQTTLRLIAQTNFDQVLSHGYSARAKAPSSKIPQNCSEIDIKRRVNEIRRYNSQLREKALAMHFKRISDSINDPCVRNNILEELVKLLK